MKYKITIEKEIEGKNYKGEIDNMLITIYEQVKEDEDIDLKAIFDAFNKKGE